MARPQSWRIVLSGWHPPSLNSYTRSRTVRSGASKKIEKLLEPWTFPQSPDRIPPAEVKRLVRVHLTYPAGARRLDPDNCLKPLLDGLKRCGLIKNDSPDWVEVPEPTDDRGLFAVTTITLTDLPPELDHVPDPDGRPLRAVYDEDSRRVLLGVGRPIDGILTSVSAADVPLFCSILRKAAAGSTRPPKKRGKAS